MNNESILSSDILDIVFDKRNKDYGAYTLRKFYPSRIKISLFIMIGIVIFFSAFTFLPASPVTDKPDIYTDSIRTVKVEMAEQKQEPKKPAQPAASYAQSKYISSIAVVPDKDSADLLSDITKTVIGSANVETDITGPVDAEPGPLVGAGSGLEPAAPAIPAPVTGPVDNPDIQASYPGGDKELVRFLQKNLRSPRDMEEQEMVEVKVKFVVGFDGNLQGFSVVRDGGEEFNYEVMRVLKKMPRWIPGKKGGQNVPVYYTIPVKFTAL